MPVTFAGLRLGEEYDRPELARLWGYKSWRPLGRGVVTPAGDQSIVLFVTKEKQEGLTQYADYFEGNELHWEGETNHQNDQRLLDAKRNGDAIHLFFRQRHHSPFTYYGEIHLKAARTFTNKESEFVFSTKRLEAAAASAIATEAATQGDPDAFEADEEGKKRLRQHVAYERSAKNRAKAIDIHGTICKACSFDFNAVYGRDYARDYIEVHHTVSISAGLRRPDPATELVPLCANCHKMAHRRRGVITPVEEIRRLLEGRSQRESQGGSNLTAKPR